MSGTEPAAPLRRWSWWHLVLIASLALNLLFGGFAVSRYFFHPVPARTTSTSFLNLVPPKFFADLDRPRREELVGTVRASREKFRTGRQASRKLAEDVAGALETTPYDEARLRAALDSFTRNGTDLIAIGGQAALELIARLSPEERVKLAQRIRDRAQGAKRK